MRLSFVCVLLSFLVLSPFAGTLCSQAENKPAEKNMFSTPKSTLDALYDELTFGPGTVPDWEKVKTFFLDQAVIVLRTGRDKMSVLDKDDFVNIFIRDIKRFKMDKTGFAEKLAKCKITQLGDIAHALVLYEASTPGSPQPPQQGVDSVHFIKKDGRWWITSIINEVIRPGVPIPEALKK